VAHAVSYSPKQHLYNVVLALSQLGNAIFAGDPDESISGRLGKCQRGDYGRTWQVAMTPVRAFVDLINAWNGGWGHCARSIEDDEGGGSAFQGHGFS
jgi:hypothetical protein